MLSSALAHIFEENCKCHSPKVHNTLSILWVVINLYRFMSETFSKCLLGSVSVKEQFGSPWRINLSKHKSFYSIRSNLRRFKKVEQKIKLPSVEAEPITLTKCKFDRIAIFNTQIRWNFHLISGISSPKGISLNHHTFVISQRCESEQKVKFS